MELYRAFRNLCAGVLGFASGLLLFNGEVHSLGVQEPATNMFAQRAMSPLKVRSFLQPNQGPSRSMKVNAVREPVREPTTGISPGQYTVEAFLAREQEVVDDEVPAPPKTAKTEAQKAVPAPAAKSRFSRKKKVPNPTIMNMESRRVQWYPDAKSARLRGRSSLFDMEGQEYISFAAMVKRSAIMRIAEADNIDLFKDLKD